jgi:hypothetical protein
LNFSPCPHLCLGTFDHWEILFWCPLVHLRHFQSLIFFLYLSHLPPVGCDPSKGYFKAGGAFFGRDREWAAASVREKKGFKFLGFFVI